MEPVPGSRWRGVNQDSWWKVLLPDDERIRVLCLRAPQRYRWIEAGEEHWMPRSAFGGSLMPL
jgi:hypothetical protein